MLASIRDRVTYFWESRGMEKAKPALLTFVLTAATCIAGVLAWRTHNG